MPKTKISEFSSTPANNTDIDSINLAEGCAPSGINDAIRELMSQLKDFQVGSAGDPVTVGGVLTVQAGSASTPALTTAGDTNTGMFFPAADTIAFAEGGVEAMRLDSSGRLAIGQTSGTQRLTVNSSMDVTDGTITTRLSQASGAALIGTSTNHAFFFMTNDSERMRLDASGNLGVGTTSPSYRLDVNGFDATARINSSTAGGNSALRFLNGTGNNASILFGDTDAADVGFIQYVHSDNSLRINVNAAERARIDSSGNLLLGATSFATSNIDATLIAKGYVIVEHVSGTSSGSGYLNFQYAGSTVGSITQSGTTAVLYNVTSDQRLKENIVDAPEFGSVIDSIKVRSYDWKAEGNHQRAGFIAQELVTVAPEAVHQPEDSEEMMAVDYSKLVPMLVKEVQSLRKRLADAGIA
jgi:hypothetical protein